MFTTIAVLDGKPFLWEKHFRRLSYNAEKVGIDLSDFSESSISSEVSREIEKSSLIVGRVRITLYDEGSSTIWSGERKHSTKLSIITGRVRRVPEHFRLTVSPFVLNSHSPLAGIKSCNYLENLMALDEAKARGFNEAIRLNERGEITSAAMANVFWLKDDVLYTPSQKTGCLAGTTREFVLENVDCREVEVVVGELETADAIFLTSAGLGVTQVAEFESTGFKKVDHPILDLLPKR